MNEKVNIRSDYYRRARAMCDSLFQTGEYFRSTIPSKTAGEKPEPETTRSLSPLGGILNFIYAITQSGDRRSVQEQRQTPRAIRSLYRRFLFYKYFISPDATLIVSEGKTDPIYLQEAIKSLTKFHPTLGSLRSNGFDFAVRFFNYEGLAHEVLDLGGGIGDLKSIPLDYLRNLRPSKNSFKPIANTPMKFPIIIVLDNDDGLASVASTIKKNFGVSLDLKSTDDFYHITDNLYVVKTPENGGKHTCIEDLFPQEWREKELNGKKLNTASKIDPSKDLSKEAFAKSIVRPNAPNIDFSKFDLLLDRICKVIRHYSPKP